MLLEKYSVSAKAVILMTMTWIMTIWKLLYRRISCNLQKNFGKLKWTKAICLPMSLLRKSQDHVTVSIT